MRLVFFGTADFAVPTLEALHKAGHDVAAVVTAPDKPAGRGYALKASPVKEAAIRLNLPLLQPEKLKDPTFLAQLEGLAPQLQVVVAFRMLPEVVWAAPPMGTVNLHGSLLPQYRGAAPIHWAVAHGEAETGVTTFFLRHEIDTGDLIYQARTPIGSDETTGEVYERMMHLGADLMARTVADIALGKAPRLPQKTSTALRHAPKLTPENTEVTPALSAEQTRNLIRGMNPYPGAWMGVRGQKLKLWAARHAAEGLVPQGQYPAGALVLHSHKTYLLCSDAWLELTEVQPEGKRRMSGTDFANGVGRTWLG